jgi:hypothetical protein
MIGDALLSDGRTAILIVPSALAPVESNWLIHPQHPHFARVRCIDLSHSSTIPDPSSHSRRYDEMARCAKELARSRARLIRPTPSSEAPGC